MSQAAGSDLCLLTPRNWLEQLASPVEVRTRRRRRVLALDPGVGRLAQDMASVSLPLSAAPASSPTPTPHTPHYSTQSKHALCSITACDQSQKLTLCRVRTASTGQGRELFHMVVAGGALLVSCRLCLTSSLAAEALD